MALGPWAAKQACGPVTDTPPAADHGSSAGVGRPSCRRWVPGPSTQEVLCRHLRKNEKVNGCKASEFFKNYNCQCQYRQKTNEPRSWEATEIPSGWGN